MREVLVDVEDKIKSGVPLSDAFEAQGIFPKIYTASLLAGEQSGALDDVLLRFVDYLRRSVGVSRKFRGALAYPAFLLVAAGLMVTFLTLYIVPRMSDLFQSLSANRGLPTVTVVVLAISHFVAGNIWWLGPLILVVGFGLYFWLRTDSGRLNASPFSAKDTGCRAAYPEHGDITADAIAFDAAFGRHYRAGFVGDRGAGIE